ncbi:MAG: ribonuclease G [Deltaproteobacteria bacterium RIFCSPLOWO2_02_FULL_57_26]|nr:MAG: ribonuclease G [Deltaproteobacteria bacterium RIFCSPLOWO2_02_FULL_57_26]OGQ82627.1 MAG: ribonuclease G [Deltaproteobacteria bacterium RIFCSPLOWO2_12_FULL_57_22]
MQQDIFINSTPQESRIAIVEDKALAEFLVERRQERGIVGNIYKGKVARVLPGMQAAFVEIGMDKAAFLHVSDFSTAYEAASPPPGSEDEIIFEGPKPSSHRRLPIERQLSRGQEILVQVAKDPLGMKGARITSYISLPGRYLVFMPTSTHVGISRRIEDDKERKRLKEIALSVLSKEGGFILRTACEGRSKREIQRDLAFLTKLWRGVQKKAEGATAPSLIHQDLDLISRTIRDFFTTDTHLVVMDHVKEYRRILDFVGHFMPRLKSKITLYSQAEPIMDHYGIEEQIAKALERKIWLHSGGYITIERTEALTAIDINTGRFVGKRNQEETVFKTNLEAAPEIVRQLRLRNVGGIIIIDFIDMEKEANRKKVYDALKEAIKKDKARTNILKISELGLVEMTRQRTRESLENVLLSACPYCEGRGRIKSHVTIAYEILRAIKREKNHLEDGKRIQVRVHPDIANFLYDDESRSLDNLEREINRKIIIKASEELHHQKYEISAI